MDIATIWGGQGRAAERPWWVIAHGIEAASWFADVTVNKSLIVCVEAGLEKNRDGSVDVCFVPKAPNGEEMNRLPTVPDQEVLLDLSLLWHATGILSEVLEAERSREDQTKNVAIGNRRYLPPPSRAGQNVTSVLGGSEEGGAQ